MQHGFLQFPQDCEATLPAAQRKGKASRPRSVCRLAQDSAPLARSTVVAQLGDHRHSFQEDRRGGPEVLDSVFPQRYRSHFHF